MKMELTRVETVVLQLSLEDRYDNLAAIKRDNTSHIAFSMRQVARLYQRLFDRGITDDMRGRDYRNKKDEDT